MFPTARQQRCWNHRILNLLDKLPKRSQAEAKRLLTAVPYAETREAAERQKRAFQARGMKKGVAAVGQALDQDWDRLEAFYDFPKAHWKRLRTTNPVDRRSQPCGCVQPRRSGTRGSTTRQRSSGRLC